MNMHRHISASAIKTTRYLYRMMLAATLSLFCVAVIVTGLAIRDKAEEWSPLGPYPEQTVDLPRSSIDGHPTISLSDPIVPVTGTKCAEVGDYRIFGTEAWQSVEPRGTSIITGSGDRNAPTDVECITTSFENVIPEQVVAAMEAQLDRGIERPLWQIVGVETPTDGDREGVTQSWRTELFGVER